MNSENFNIFCLYKETEKMSISGENSRDTFIAPGNAKHLSLTASYILSGLHRVQYIYREA